MKTPLLCLVALAAAWYFGVAPMRAEIATLRARVSNVDAEIQRSRAAAVALPALEREVRKLESALKVLRPDDRAPLNASAVIADLQSAAAESHLRITALKPRNESNKREGGGQPVELGIDGSFHDVGHFLGRLASLPRMMTSRDIVIRTLMSGRGGGGNVTGSLVVVAFDLLPELSATDEPLEYDDGGRRDPFASALEATRLLPALAVGRRGGGLAATPLSEVVVRGVTRDGDRMFAILETSGRQSFVVRARDRLADSTVHDIDPSGVLFVQRDGRGAPVPVHKPLRRSNVEHP
jgi:Tfp pilus assembly protein PilO